MYIYTHAHTLTRGSPQPEALSANPNHIYYELTRHKDVVDRLTRPEALSANLHHTSYKRT